MNRLYFGDCLTILQDFPLASVDLIYLDPPWNSNRQYNAIYRDETGRPLPDQVEAFCDTWELDNERERVIRAMPVLMRENGIDDDTAELWRLWMRALRHTQPRLLAYLSYMAQRLLVMHRILKPTGTLYLHCDPTASHYIKALLDGIFGHRNFRNEIIWSYRRWPAKQRNFQRMHDVILRYSRGSSPTWNQLYEPLAASTRKRFGTKQQVADFSTGKRLPRQTDDESPTAPMRDVWDISILAPVAKERMGYATQKPLRLMERIVAASSNEGDVVLDPFCGCATTLEAAHRLGRRWIGIDIAIHAVKRVASVRLTERCGLVEGQDFTVEGVPRNLEGARDLWERDKYHFQKWAVEQVDGFVTSKQTADGGIDGRLYFALPNEPDLQSMVLEVKGGRTVSIRDLRALCGVLDNGEALLAGLIVLNDLGPTQARNFARFAAGAGTLDVLGIEYPRLQVLTVAEILDGRRFKTPTVVGRHEPQPAMPGIPSS